MIVKDDKDPIGLEEGAKAYKFNDVVKFDFKYPSGYTKTKHQKEGVIEIHKLQAEDFATRGFGKIIK